MVVRCVTERCREVTKPDLTGNHSVIFVLYASARERNSWSVTNGSVVKQKRLKVEAISVFASREKSHYTWNSTNQTELINTKPDYVMNRTVHFLARSQEALLDSWKVRPSTTLLTISQFPSTQEASRSTLVRLSWVTRRIIHQKSCLLNFFVSDQCGVSAEDMLFYGGHRYPFYCLRWRVLACLLIY